ncbi:MAG: DNA polymerase III subunit gamma/tau [Conchiformibius sp.]|nr:DNA polymerase III subunit gamma/tau [Conchiformibius sp.]
MTAYQVLARKWRPKTFADLVGQQHVVQALQNALSKGRLHHAYLLTGTRGVGKTTIARILAKSLNCTQAQHGEPCGHCGSCTAIDQGRFPDLLEIDAASNTGIDNIREVLENAQYAPTAGQYKVYIIDEVHMLSKSAFNAMLKTLEEPPAHVKFILATTDPHKVPVTVLSRCLQFVLRNMTPQQVSAHLAHVLDSEGIAYQAPALTLIARAAAGSMRDALSLLDQSIALGSGSVNEQDVRQMLGAADQSHLYELLAALMEQDGQALVAAADRMAANAVGFEGALNDLAALLHRLALIKTVPSALAADDPEHDTLQHLSHYFGGEQLQLYYQCALHGKQDLPLAPDEYTGFVMTLLRMLAFAPFAAHHTPADGLIEGTQLHNEAVTAAPAAAKSAAPVRFKPQDLPPPRPQEVRRQAAVARAPAPVQAAASVDNNDLPPWEEHTLPESPPPAEYHDTETFQAAAYANDDLPPWENNTLPENPPPAEYHDTETFQAAAPADDDLPPWEDNTLPESPPPAEYHDTETFQAAASTDDNVWPPEQTVQAAAHPLEREQWFDTAARIGKQVAAAQMPLQHLAWVSFEHGVLTLAVVRDKTKNTAQSEYFERIGEALSALNGAPVQLHITDWQDGQGWETPYQYRQRLQREQREQARQLLEQDPTAQQLRQTFQADWREDSLQLHQETA